MTPAPRSQSEACTDVLRSMVTKLANQREELERVMAIARPRVRRRIEAAVAAAEMAEISIRIALADIEALEEEHAA